MIVKVQISLYTSEHERQVLIYDQSRSIYETLPLSACPGLEDALADMPLPRAFFTAHIANGKVHLDERVAEQEW